MNDKWTRRWASLLVVGLVSVPTGWLGHAAESDKPSREIEVSWDFGSGPGKTSNFYVGKKMIRVSYSSSECLGRFSLESVRFELAEVEGSDARGPSFVMLAFKKHFEGDFESLPSVSVVQNEANKKGKPTGRKQTVTFPFREKEMAAPVEDWSRAEIDVFIAAPGAATKFHNPFDWSEIIVACE